MKLKLDENLGTRGQEELRAAGHDVSTVAEQDMTSATDPEVIATCAQEGRCLVTLDLGFANPLVYNPSGYAGIVVLRVPSRASLAHVLAAIRAMLRHAEANDVRGKLWIVETDRLREYRPLDEPD